MKYISDKYSLQLNIPAFPSYGVYMSDWFITFHCQQIMYILS